MIRKGGGGTVSGAFAVIGVSYPSGSSCTLSKGSKIYRAQDTSGTALFAVPEAGDWIITITDGSRTRARSVAITERGQVEKVVISYSTVLFEPGSGSEALWETSGTGSASSQNITLDGYVSYGTTYSGWAYLKTAMSMAGLSALTIQSEITHNKYIQSSDGLAPTFVYLIEEDFGPTSAENAAITQPFPDGDRSGANAWEIDIKDLNQEKQYYVSFYTCGRTSQGEPGQVFSYDADLTVTGAVLA